MQLVINTRLEKQRRQRQTRLVTDAVLRVNKQESDTKPRQNTSLPWLKMWLDICSDVNVKLADAARLHVMCVFITGTATKSWGCFVYTLNTKHGVTQCVNLPLSRTVGSFNEPHCNKTHVHTYSTVLGSKVPFFAKAHTHTHTQHCIKVEACLICTSDPEGLCG